jgi:hypothetical protein
MGVDNGGMRGVCWWRVSAEAQGRIHRLGAELKWMLVGGYTETPRPVTLLLLLFLSMRAHSGCLPSVVRGELGLLMATHFPPSDIPSPRFQVPSATPRPLPAPSAPTLIPMRAAPFPSSHPRTCPARPPGHTHTPNTHTPAMRPLNHLVELPQPKELRVLHDDGVDVRDVNPVLHNRCCNHQVGLAQLGGGEAGWG